MISKSKVTSKNDELRHLDLATQEIISRININDRRLRFWGFITLTLLLTLGLVGIYKQNQIANQNKQHIDCIVKLLATPLPQGTRSRVLSNPSTSCNIKFTP